MSKTNVAVFVSGSGTNFQAIIDADIEAANLAVLVCNKPEAYAIQRAETHGIPVELVNHKDYSTCCTCRFYEGLNTFFCRTV